MKLFIYATYDSKAQVYSQPFYMQSRGAAIRSFTDISKDSAHPIGKHPEDYSLFELGFYDDSNASFSLTASPSVVGNAHELRGL